MPSPPHLPVHVERRYFCCCIPTRLGTVILSTILCSLSLWADIIAVRVLLNADLTDFSWCIVLALALAFLLAALISILGLLGALFGHRVWVAWFYDLIWVLIWVSVPLGVLGIVIVSLPGQKVRLVNACTAQSTADLSWTLVAGYCKASVAIKLVAVDLLWALSMLVELWLAAVVGKYLDQLADEEAATLGFDLEVAFPPYLLRDKLGRDVTARFVEEGAARAQSAGLWSRLRHLVRSRHRPYEQMRSPRVQLPAHSSDDESEKQQDR